MELLQVRKQRDSSVSQNNELKQVIRQMKLFVDTQLERANQ